jgi:hypothetical protein
MYIFLSNFNSFNIISKLASITVNLPITQMVNGVIGIHTMVPFVNESGRL